MVILKFNSLILLQAKPWSVNSIGDLFWGIVNFFSLFFRTLINPDANKNGDGYTTDYRASGRRGGPPPGPRRRFGGFGGGSGAPSAPPYAGGGG